MPTYWVGLYAKPKRTHADCRASAHQHLISYFNEHLFIFALVFTTLGTIFECRGK